MSDMKERDILERRELPENQRPQRTFSQCPNCGIELMSGMVSDSATWCPECAARADTMDTEILARNGRKEPITAGDTALTNEEFIRVVNLARHVVTVSKGAKKRMVTVRDVTFATFILELVGVR